MSESNDLDRGSAERGSVDRGTYELIRDRLLGHGAELGQRATALNGSRLELFGGTEMAVLGNQRIRTDNNCVPRDIVAVGDRLLFGYQVFLGLKRATTVDDVLSVHGFVRSEDGFEFQHAPPGEVPWLADASFQREFRELYAYYKETRLLQLRRVEGRLLAVFQIGEKADDIKVFRWALEADGTLAYIDNRGERDHVFPPSHDFEWTATSRDDHVSGRHPHVSILDQVFVETVGGDLTVKVEDNTDSGQGIYAEPVDDRDQSLDDAAIEYARLGHAIVLRILPYRETAWRYLVFNTRTHQVDRIDAIAHACVQLPEDHGFVFPGGYYLASGETKTFDGNVAGMEFMGVTRSPNGEDVLYAFHRRDDGSTLLLPYNLIRKEVTNPLRCHGWSLFEDGNLVLFKAASDEPTRVHPMQIWQTPFVSDLHAQSQPAGDSQLERVGNRELVRGISDALSLRRMVEEQQPTRQKYEDLIAAAERMLDAYYWLDNVELGNLAAVVREIRGTAESIIDEFEKVEALRAQAQAAIADAVAEQTALVRSLRPETWNDVDQYVTALAELRKSRGHAITLREVRYVDLERLDALEQEAVDAFDRLSGDAVRFLLSDTALLPYHRRLGAVEEKIEAVAKVADVTPLGDEVEAIADGLNLLTEVVGTLQIDDATVRTRILEAISETLGSANRARALVAQRRKLLMHSEGVAEFGAQFNLFGQSVTSALGMCDTPDKADQHLSRLMLQLEELESRFSEFDEFLEQLTAKREEVYDAFSARKQQLLDERQRRAHNLMQAAERILSGVARRVAGFSGNDELNSYFASDPMIAKLRDLSDGLRELGDSVRADEVDSKLKSAREDAARSLRDRQDIFEEGAEVIRLGQHRFSVNTQAQELTMLPRDGAMSLHLTGTDFFQPVADESFQETRPMWEQLLVSETTEVYRGEYLAAGLLDDAEQGRSGLSLERLHAAALDPSALLALVRDRAAERYEEGYARGVHDHDGAAILGHLLALHATADLLRYTPAPRAWAALFWATSGDAERRDVWQRHARNLARLRDRFERAPAIRLLGRELGERIGELCASHELPAEAADLRAAGDYLFEEIAREPVRFVLGADAHGLIEGFRSHLSLSGDDRHFADDLTGLEGDLARRFQVTTAWLGGYLDRLDAETAEATAPRHAVEEAAVAILTETDLGRDVSTARLEAEATGLLGQHRRIDHGRLPVRLDECLARLGRFRQQRVPAYRAYQERRHALLETEKKQLRLEEFRPKVMSSFVRNRLIDEVYLPLIGDNLAKQMGALGANKRTDLMGMLLLISPPGYGKTTLMEYIANRLGLVFMKINGPALGHSVTSLDPAEAPSATARQEVEKINLAFEMGNNVLLYLDDIQHTNPELLQKFISLCDAQRKVEGVWRGQTRTYNLRGKKFCVTMAGNPYTESGERFQIPDMLANRADIYNLGDILDGKDDLFALSYIENALTSNRVLAPLTTREPGDVHKLVRMAAGEEIQADQLSHEYSSVEVGEILALLRHLLRAQALLLAVNRQYIASAAQQDAYRTEPPFRLQGSYRNMNKLAEKIVPAMNQDELEALFDNHYVGEAQTLTSGAEENLLKLAELRGRMSDAQVARWDEIKGRYQRLQSIGGDEDNPVTRVTGQLSLVTTELAGIANGIRAAGDGGGAAGAPALGPYLERLDQTLRAVAEAKATPQLRPSADRDFLTKQASLIDATLIPLLQSMAHQLQKVEGLTDRKLKRLLPKLEYVDTLGDLMNALEKVSAAVDAAAPAKKKRAKKKTVKKPPVHGPGEDA